MRTVDEHLTEILGSVKVLPPLDLALLEAQGTVLAEPVSAPVPLPPFDNSAMDGYAVVAADIAAAADATPVTLPVVGDIVAGDSCVSAIRSGLTARIMTGAPLPAMPTRSSRSSGRTVGTPTCASSARPRRATTSAGPARTSSPDRS